MIISVSTGLGPWGQKPDGPWATSEETAYPWPLARAIAAQVVIQPQDQGIVFHLPSFAEQECTLQACVPPPTFSHAETPEFQQVIHQDSHTPLPSDARLLSTPKRGYVASAKETKDNQVTVGVHFSLLEFLNEAVRLCHPTEHSSLFPKGVKANIAYLSSKTVRQVVQDRTEEVKRWVALSTELVTKEGGLKSSLSPRIAEVLKDQRLCILKALLSEAGHEDLGLVDDIKTGLI